MPKGSDTWDVQSNCHVYFPANGEAKINCTRLSGCVCGGRGRTFLPWHVIPSMHQSPQSFPMSQRAQGCPPVCHCGLDMSLRSATAISILPSLHHVPMCLLPTPGLLQPARGCWWVCSELPEQGWTLCWEQSRATSCTGGSAPSRLPNAWCQTSSSSCSTISRSPLQVCNLRKTNKCRAA